MRPGQHFKDSDLPLGGQVGEPDQRQAPFPPDPLLTSYTIGLWTDGPSERVEIIVGELS